MKEVKREHSVPPAVALMTPDEYIQARANQEETEKAWKAYVEAKQDVYNAWKAYREAIDRALILCEKAEARAWKPW